jgi:hypothetical protein
VGAEHMGGGTGGSEDASEVRISRMAERARFGEGRGGLSEEDCVVPGGERMCRDGNGVCLVGVRSASC